MGQYQNFEHDFIERTLNLISQYEGWLNKVEFDQQYNYTLLINCLLGMIVMPKERIVNNIPIDRFTIALKKDMGLEKSKINPELTTLRELIIALRHSIAHFDIEIVSIDHSNLIDEIVFKDEKAKGVEYEVVRFCSAELLPFLRYYGGWLMSNLKKRKDYR